MSTLKRQLGLIDVFSIAAGSMVSSGLFILPGLAYYKSGPAVILAYLVAGILILPSMLSKAELSTAMPKSGGTYFFINRSMGAGFGTIAGISAWLSLALKSAFALVGIGAFASLLFPGISLISIKFIAVAFCIFFTIINLRSTKHAGRMQVIMVMVLIGLLFFYVVRGIPQVSNRHFEVFMIGDISNLFMTAGLIFISYGGLTKVASVAEEVKNPSRNIPLGMMLAFFIVTVAYVLVVFVTVGVLGDALLRPAPQNFTLTPISDGAAVFAGKPGMILLSIAALLAFFSTANAGIMAASRNPMAMAKDHLLPSLFGKVSASHNTPVTAILFTSAFMIVMIFLPLEMLVKTASTMMLLLFIFENISVIIMRESGIQNYRPKFKSPLYPYIQIFAVIAYIFIIIEMGSATLMLTGIFVAGGLLWYALYGRIRYNRESALVQLVNRVKARDLVSSALDSELREIIRERDDIQKDRFDHLIENAEILDIPHAISKDEFFQLAGARMCSSLTISCDTIIEKMIQREDESSTVIADNLAIPHIILDGEKKFSILLVRCKEGIHFSDDTPKVQIVFVIAGSRDERTFHLRALAAIAQIVQNPNFEKKWLRAKNIESLRDIVLLGERKRHN